MSNSKPVVWEATDYAQHTSSKLIRITKKTSIPVGKVMDTLSDYERTSFYIATKKDGSAAEIEQWATGLGKQHVSSSLPITVIHPLDTSTGVCPLR